MIFLRRVFFSLLSLSLFLVRAKIDDMSAKKGDSRNKLDKKGQKKQKKTKNEEKRF